MHICFIWQPFWWLKNWTFEKKGGIAQIIYWHCVWLGDFDMEIIWPVSMSCLLKIIIWPQVLKIVTLFHLKWSSYGGPGGGNHFKFWQVLIAYQAGNRVLSQVLYIVILVGTSSNPGHINSWSQLLFQISFQIFSLIWWGLAGSQISFTFREMSSMPIFEPAGKLKQTLS